MNTSTSNLKDKVVKRAVNSLRKSKRIEQLSFVAIANELNVRVDEIQAFYTTTEDIFLEAQKKDWESLHRYWDRNIKKSKTLLEKSAFDLENTKNNLFQWFELR